MNLDLTDTEAEALAQELAGIVQNNRYPPLAARSDVARDTRQAEARASPRAFATAEGVCAAASQEAKRPVARKSGSNPEILFAE